MSTTTRQRHGDTMAIITVELESAIVEWQEILDVIKVEPDDWDCESPWENCDGYDHFVEDAIGPDEDSFTAFQSMHTGRMQMIVMEYDQGTHDWYRAKGASKGVARQLTLQSMRKRIDQLVGWYCDGWEWWGVSGEIHGCCVSVWGVDSYDYAVNDVKTEIADELAHELTAKGYEVTGEPDAKKPDSNERRERFHRNINFFNMTT